MLKIASSVNTTNAKSAHVAMRALCDRSGGVDGEEEDIKITLVL